MIWFVQWYRYIENFVLRRKYARRYRETNIIVLRILFAGDLFTTIIGRIFNSIQFNSNIFIYPRIIKKNQNGSEAKSDHSNASKLKLEHVK